MNKSFKKILFSLFPLIIFFAIYKLYSLHPAIIVSLAISMVAIIFKKIKSTLSRFDFLNLFAVIIQSAVGLSAVNPKAYYYYPVIENLIYLLIFLVMSLMGRNLVAFFARDLTDSESYEICLPAYKKLSYLWIVFFALKLAIRVVGLIKMNFDGLIVLNYALGTPASVLMLWFTFYYPVKYYRENSDLTPDEEVLENKNDIESGEHL